MADRMVQMIQMILMIQMIQMIQMSVVADIHYLVEGEESLVVADKR